MKTEHIGVRLTPEEKEKLKKIAVKQDLSMSLLVRQLIRDYLNQEEEYED